MPKISIIIPVYNTEEYLQQCLNSVLTQTLSDIEIICVDDASTDHSYEILQNYRNNDSRVKVFHFDKSKSALQARKTGVMAANGDYIMFLDADDYLEQTSCEKLYNKIEEANVDILHFSSNVVNCANVNPKRIEHNESLIRPYPRKLTGENIFTACFVDKKYFIQLWNKIYRTSICKKAFSNIEDIYLPKAQDFYTYYVISHYAESYLGWITEPLHNYCFGRGVTGSKMNLDKFERYCTQANVISALKRFSETQKISQYQAILQRYYEQWITECLKIWKNDLPKVNSVEGLQLLYQYWGVDKTLQFLAKNFWFQRSDIAHKLENYPQIDLKTKDIKTVAFYYYHFSIGGVQRVISLLVPMFVKMGYKVVLITDSEPEENDYVFPDNVIRATICNHETTNAKNIGNRFASWAELMEAYHFDIVLYNAWTSNLLMWDTLFLKGYGIPVIVHAHNVFSMNVNKMGHMFFEFARTFTLTDGIVTLSQADKVFWDSFNANVHHILNPVSPELHNANAAKWGSKSLIWVARVSDEKQPWMIFDIMAKVIQDVPDAHLYLLGNFDDPKWEKLSQDKGIAQNVEFCGMIHNVNDFYEKATVHVVTSRYEGFLMTLLEAMAHGLPTVAFEMPNLTLAKKERGVISVDMNDTTSAAVEVVKLLKERDHWESVSSLAKNSYEQVKAYDIETAWENVLRGNNPPCAISQDCKDMLHTLINHYEIGFRFKEKQLRGLRQTPEQFMMSKYEQDTVRSKGRRVLIYILEKLLGGVYCWEMHGFRYTVKHAIKKLVKRFIH